MSLALALVLAAQAGAAAPAPGAAAKKPAAPLSVQVQASPKGGAAAKAWGDELRAAVEARKDEFRAARPGEKPEVVVQIDAVGPATKGSAAGAVPKDASIMKGAIVVGGTPHPFGVTYTGPSKPQTEALARNLRKYAEQLKATPPAK
jgi:hypothetical protein